MSRLSISFSFLVYCHLRCSLDGTLLLNLVKSCYSDVSSGSSVSSDDDLDDVETAWTDVLVGIDDRPFGAGVDAAVPGCSFVLPKVANEFDYYYY